MSTNTQTFKVLSIDAWAGDEPGSWDWNNWYNVGTVDIDINASKDAILKAMLDQGFITQIAGGDIEDDQYNLVIVDDATREPIFAIEYGSTI